MSSFQHSAYFFSLVQPILVIKSAFAQVQVYTLPIKIQSNCIVPIKECDLGSGSVRRATPCCVIRAA